MTESSFIKRIHRALSAKELKNDSEELARLKNSIREHMNWCAYDSPEIGHAMMNLLRKERGVDSFRDQLRKGELTFDALKEKI
ncbi:hypothetical protein [uncultured Paraglaciecola sp.]|uniref:hypothetical protein n=1 Tax=uncultured Paraglaciecola sp. TaxID=1765024 RepID=UPI0026187C8A|nr:hypothetical protein [uncultured Paraglaciecola sp.]